VNLEPAANIALLVLDVDGVLTDGRLWFGPGGETLKVFHVRDGAGIKALQAAGVAVAIISGRRSDAVSSRATELGVRYVYQGIADKAAACQQLLAELRLAPAQTACVVDDTPDLPLLALCGFSVAVADAHPAVRAAASHVTRAAGGAGAVREVCDLLIAARA
jgi:3-deoxy-D-manno-octulosonate 8-phosphate phosphatase (KDO 8-P phosphatase)